MVTLTNPNATPNAAPATAPVVATTPHYTVETTVQYFNNLKAIKAQRTKARNDARTAYDAKLATLTAPAERRKVETAYSGLNTAIEQRFNARVALEFAELAFSPEPVVAWMATNCTNYREHAELMWKHLERHPDRTLDQLQKFANDSGWCGTFKSLMDQAAAAGVLYDGRTPAQRELESFVSPYFSYQRDKDNLNQRVQALMNESLERGRVEGRAQAEAEAEAKARAAAEAAAEAAKAATPAEPELITAADAAPSVEPLEAEVAAELAADRELVAA